MTKFCRWKPCTACSDGRRCQMLTSIDCIMIIGPVIWCRVFAVILPWFLRFSQKSDVFFTIFAVIFYCPYCSHSRPHHLTFDWHNWRWLAMTRADPEPTGVVTWRAGGCTTGGRGGWRWKLPESQGQLRSRWVWEIRCGWLRVEGVESLDQFSNHLLFYCWDADAGAACWWCGDYDDDDDDDFYLLRNCHKTENIWKSLFTKNGRYNKTNKINRIIKYEIKFN